MLYNNENLDDLFEVMKSSLSSSFTDGDIESVDSKYAANKVSKEFHDKVRFFQNSKEA